MTASRLTLACTRVKPHLRPHARPLAAPENVIQGDRYRITVLDPGLLRLEYAASGEFEDRPSQTVLDRAFEPREFQLTESDAGLELHTERLQLVYDKRPFSTEGLSVAAKGGVSNYDSVWRFGLHVDNLGGTARTLDEADGRVPLEDGVLAATGSRWSTTRARCCSTRTAGSPPAGRTRSTSTCSRSAATTAPRCARSTSSPARQPLLPRYALGNWWSRYYPYSADEYLELMDRFAEEDLPFSVAVLDMDWHLVDIDPSLGSGWTGYTFNRELFPDPTAFMAELHERGLAVSLNVHPADGVRAYEDAYPQVAERMGIDPATELPVNFDPTDPRFLEAYLEEVHHPLEEQGVDFWWLDWQQGVVTKVPGLDPLWLLNHFHFLDSARNGNRPLTFSRYAGIGSHRYPVGFSGDTVVSWESLRLPARVHRDRLQRRLRLVEPRHRRALLRRQGRRARTRWVQFGVFSPILRLHSTADRFIAKEPWRFGEVARRLIGESLRLRHRLVPYIATMGLRAHEDGAPLVSPMYYDHPSERAAYGVPNQFMFGTELLVAPITEPADPGTRMGSVEAWLPEGEWIDVFTGLRYRGGRRIALHRDLDSIPVLVRPGTVLPLAADGPRHGPSGPRRAARVRRRRRLLHPRRGPRRRPLGAHDVHLRRRRADDRPGRWRCGHAARAHLRRRPARLREQRADRGARRPGPPRRRTGPRRHDRAAVRAARPRPHGQPGQEPDLRRGHRRPDTGGRRARADRDGPRPAAARRGHRAPARALSQGP